MPPFTNDDSLAEGWRYSSATVDNALVYIEQYRRLLADPATPLKDQTAAKIMLPKHLTSYLAAVRRVSEAEAEMERRGIQFNRVAA